MRAAHLRQHRDLRLAVEDVQPVAAEEGEAPAPREAVPQLLERDCRLGVAALAEEVDQLAEDANLAVGKALRELVEQAADDALEGARRRKLALEDQRQQALGVLRDEQTFLLEGGGVPAGGREALGRRDAPGGDDERSSPDSKPDAK